MGLSVELDDIQQNYVILSIPCCATNGASCYFKLVLHLKVYMWREYMEFMSCVM